MVGNVTSHDRDLIQGLRVTYCSASDGGLGLDVSLQDCSSFSSSFDQCSATDERQAQSIFRQEERQECNSLSVFNGTSWHLDDCSARDATGVEDFTNINFSESLLTNAPVSPKRKHVTSIQPSKRCRQSWIRLASPIDASSFESFTKLTNEISLGFIIEQTNANDEDSVQEWNDDLYGEEVLNSAFEVGEIIPAEPSPAE